MILVWIEESLGAHHWQSLKRQTVDASEVLQVAGDWARKQKENVLLSRAKGLTSGPLLPVQMV